VTGFPASGLLKSTSVRPLSVDRIFTSWPSSASCIPLAGLISCSWKCFVGIILTICGFRFPNASSGLMSTVYFFPESFPIKSLSKPVGSILCPTDKINGLMSLVFRFAFSACFFMFVSKISSVPVMLPVNSTSMKSFFLILINEVAILGF